MHASPQFEKELVRTEFLPSAIAIREQLRRLLAHPLFLHSKRYPVLLAYVVEQALLGHENQLKERTIGVEAFGREATYDVTLDPVVRTTAAEVRKRLIQYYHSPDHIGELVIELLAGSYVPYFREPANSQTEIGLAATQSEDQHREPVVPSSAHVDTLPNRSRYAARHWALVGAALVCTWLIGFGTGHIRPANHPSNLDRFWAPITETSSRVTYCLGEPNEAVERATKSPGSAMLYADVKSSDVVALARSIIPLVPRNGSFHVLIASNADLTQLREGPDVLIGAFDNQWTLRLTEELPFGFVQGKIVDRRTPKRSWEPQWLVPLSKLPDDYEDYAIVARIHDKVTGQPAVILAGILGGGTEAASELVSNPAYLNMILQKVPKNWDQLNLEAVIETHVIANAPGPPMVLAVETW